MTQVSIGTFNRVRFTFVIHRVVNSRPIEYCLVALIIITEVIMPLNTLSKHVLEFSATSFGAYLPGKNTASLSIDKG